MYFSKSIDFKIFHGVTSGVACSISLLGLSFLVSTTYDNLTWNQEQWNCFWKKKLYLPLVLGFPLGFMVGYTEKNVFEHLCPLLKLKFDNKIE